MARTTIQSTTERPDLVLENYIKKLDTFLAQSMLNLKNMKNKHQQMSVSWKGEQYDRFTVILNETIKDAAKELTEIQKLREFLVKKLKEIKEAMRHKL